MSNSVDNRIKTHNSRILMSRQRRDVSDSDSESDADGINLVERLARRRQKQLDKVLNPMTRGCKYTLRSSGYVPFRKRLADKRSDKQLEQRGGTVEMERFVQLRQEKEMRERLHQESEKHYVDLESILAEEEQLKRDEELEKLLQDEEEDELDDLFSKLDLR